MKLVQTEKTFSTNADFTSQDFTIGDVSVVIEILRNKLYRHKVRTLVQEYISNARDAMREAGNKTDRIEITIPTNFEPTFKVRDYGIGINPDRMYNVFIKYASSTKRDSNKQTGGFGIGAKSAWSYTESFTIVTYIDGVQRSYVAHIGANNNGRLDYLGESHTDKANGTEIQIPVSPKDTVEFKQAALRATYFWSNEDRPTFKNLAKDSLDAYSAGDMIDIMEVNNLLPSYIVSSWERGIVIAIDGIPYVIDASLSEKVPALAKLCGLVTGRVVLHVGNGQLEVSASREEIADSKFTLDNLQTICLKLVNKVTDKLTTEFKIAKTPFEHLTIYLSLNKFYELSAFNKFGEFTMDANGGINSELFSRVKIELCDLSGKNKTFKKEHLNRNGRSYYSRNRSGAIKQDWIESMYFNESTDTMMITNYRLKALIENGGKEVIVISALPNYDVEYKEVKKSLGLKDLSKVVYTKPAKQTRELIKVARTKQEFCIQRLDRYSHRSHYTTLEKNTTKWLYVGRDSGYNDTDLRSLNDYIKGYTLCELSQEALKRVKGDANFKPLADYLKAYKATASDIASLKTEVAKNRDMTSKLTKLSGLTDNFIRDMINEYKTHSINNGFVPAILKTIIGKVDEVEQFKIDDHALTQELKKRYPLLDLIVWSGLTPSMMKEIVSYMNAKQGEENV